MVTRGHKQDELSLRATIDSKAAYVGMIGSRRRTAAVLQHLGEEGLPQEALDRVHTPIGLDIGAETPEEIAVSIIAELIMERRGGRGGSMYFRRGQRVAEPQPASGWGALAPCPCPPSISASILKRESAGGGCAAQRQRERVMVQETGTWLVKRGHAQMLKGGVIMDVVTPSRRE